jgi:hypothetical protein
MEMELKISSMTPIKYSSFHFMQIPCLNIHTFLEEVQKLELEKEQGLTLTSLYHH